MGLWSVAQAMDTIKKIQDELFESIKQQEFARVREILTDYPELANAERINYEVSTPLMEACSSGK